MRVRFCGVEDEDVLVVRERVRGEEEERVLVIVAEGGPKRNQYDCFYTSRR